MPLSSPHTEQHRPPERRRVPSLEQVRRLLAGYRRNDPRTAGGRRPHVLSGRARRS
jgi:hypothetical protein